MDGCTQKEKKRRLKEIVKGTWKKPREKNYTLISQRIYIRKIAGKSMAIQPLVGRFYLKKSGLVFLFQNCRKTCAAVFCSVVIRF